MRILLLSVALMAALTAAAESVNLAEQVTIRRTEYGVPHILAESEKAAAYGFAWVQAEDHFPLLYRSMVRGRSEMSRYYGASEEHIEFDFQTRQLRARKLVVDHYHLLPADYRGVVEGFAAGINGYMAAHPEETEAWMTPVTPHDVLSAWQVAVMRFTFLRGNIIGRFQRAMEESDGQQTTPGPEPHQEIGSNAIALAPSRTESGHAMLLNNPHQPWSDQARYYEAHITVPGVYNFFGSTFIGGHLLTTGFSEHLGWAHTVNYPDLEEFYEVTRDPDHPDQYLFDGGSVPFEKDTTTITLDDGSQQSRETWWSPLGPVVYKTAEKAYILRSAGQGQYRTGLQWYRMAQAANLAEFREVLRMQQIPMFNIGYADQDGNILYLWNGTVPKLPHAGHGLEAVPADDSDEIWTTVHPLSDLMQLLNPPGGYVQNCNSPPYLTNLHAPLDRAAYPDYFPDNDLSLRTQVGLSLIHNERRYSLEDLIDAKYTTRLLLADRVKPDLLRILEAADLSSEEREALAMMRAWDNTASAESAGSVLFKVFWDEYRGEDDDFAVGWREDEPMATPRGLGAPDRALAAFRAAMAETKKRWGSWRVAWGDVHRLRRGDTDLPMGGASWRLGCFRVMHYEDADDGKLVANGGDGYVFAVEFGDQPKAYSVLAYSQSGRPGSPHYNDQGALFANEQMKPVPFTEEAIAAKRLREYRPE